MTSDPTLLLLRDPESIREWSITFKGHTKVVNGVAFSPDGKRVASASFDETVRVWDAASGQEIFTLRGHDGAVWSVAFSPDGKRLFSAGDQVEVWDTTNGQETLTLKGHSDTVMGVAVSRDGRRLASSSADQTVKLWDATPRSAESTPDAKAQ